MSLIVKICGLSTRETLDVALHAGADMVGFVFFPASPRHIGLDTARDLGRQAKGRALKVALTVDADDATLANIVEALAAGYPAVARQGDRGAAARHQADIRLAGDEGDRGGNLGRSRIPARLRRGCRSYPVRRPCAEEATRPGGLGAVFDWHVLENLDLKLPFMVSGGLHAGNVAEAVRVSRAGGVDVSSGVERAPGIKDPEMIRAFIRAARATEELIT